MRYRHPAVRHEAYRVDCRLIPAHAGKTTSHDPAHRSAKAHPRSCGENPLLVVGDPRRQGSSPLTRGKRHRDVRGRLQGRLILDHAGKTCVYGAATRRAGAHPRSCGENTRVMAMPEVEAGSSPPMRGKRRGRRRSHLPARLIPAHAGKTQARWGSQPLPRAHPRSHGENAPIATTARPIGGSSPLTRGKRIGALPHDEDLGLIPAHAGKTFERRRTRRTCWAYPRSRGENLTTKDTSGRPLGSSPLARGKLGRLVTERSKEGLIPAHAGKTPILLGENCRYGLIPAHAGKTRLRRL